LTKILKLWFNKGSLLKKRLPFYKSP
jgi:hypothetical protein